MGCDLRFLLRHAGSSERFATALLLGDQQTSDLIQFSGQGRSPSAPVMSELGQKHALPHRSIAVRFALNKQTLTERVQCDVCASSGPHAVQQNGTA
jgi:hypothetical protein